MARNPVTDLSAWPSLTLEGNLIAPAMVASLAAPKDDEETRQSYRIRKGLSIRDEISTAFRVGQSHFDSFRKITTPSADVARRFMRDFLAETLGFDDLAPHEGAVCLLAGGRVPIVVIPPAEEKLDRKSPTLSSDRSRSAAFALQDYLNDHDDALWGLATNGTVLRLMRDNASLTRPAYIEADLAQIFTNEDAASFAVLWLLCHRTRFGLAGAPATDCALERWRDAGAKEGEAARDRLAGQVQLALKLLGSGFLEANPDLSKRLQSGDIPLTGWFNELLRLVYRLIFLMVAEDRNLLHPPKAPAAARKLYAEGYSLSALRAACTRAATWDRHHDRYEGVKIAFHALAAGEEKLALPALGGVFAADQLPNLGTARLRNCAFMEALYRLSWLTDEKKTGMVPVNWRAMETEELGSVYESLLELQPQLGSDGRSLLFASDAAEQRGNQRKITGSFYTPDPLVQALLDTALDPVLDRIEADAWRMANGEWRVEVSESGVADGEWKSFDRALGHPAYRTHVHQILSGSGGVAKRSSLGQSRLPADEKLSQGGVVRDDFPDARSTTQPDEARRITSGQRRLEEAPTKEQIILLWTNTPFAIRYSLFAAQALLGLRIIDPACGSGHFLLAAARRIATRLARIRGEGTPSTEDFRHALRDVARCCIHGVDRNPMAVELTKVALWIETVDPGLPLGFFDAQIRCGDALLGVFDLKVLEDGIPDAAYKPLTGDDRDTARYYLQANRGARIGQGELNLGGSGGTMPDTKPLAVDFSIFRALPEETVTQIGAKAKRFEELRQKPEFTRVQTAADLYVSAFLLPKTGGAPTNPAQRTVPITEELWQVLNQGKLRESMAAAPQAARRARAFHWPLEFPDVMQRGGFDVVLGNPPWERIKLQEQEFFAARSPEIANAANKAARDRLVEALSNSPEGRPERALLDEFFSAKREAEASSEFARLPGEDGGRFPLTGRGDVNTYALFAELFANLTRVRAGVIVPTGIATDSTTAAFFEDLVRTRKLHSLHDFQTGLGFFDRIGHARFKFCLLTLVAAGGHPEKINFSFYSRTAEEFGDHRRHFTLSIEEIKLVNPNTRTVPVFRTSSDAHLTAKIYGRVPVLINEGKGPEGNPWKMSFASLFHMSNDSILFRTHAQLRGDGWRGTGFNLGCSNNNFVPLYEAKMIHLFDHRWATYDPSGESSSPLPCKNDPNSEPLARYWVPQAELDSRLAAKNWQRDWLMGWRDICRATDERTVIASIIPLSAVGHTMPLFFPETKPSLWACLLACFTSITLDFCARQAVGGTHLTYGYLKQFPVLPPAFYTVQRLDFIVPRVLELTYTSHSLAPFARDLGYDGPPFGWDEDRRALLRAELDAFYARAYGLDRDELRYILDPADVKGPDYPSETFRVLKEKEIRQHGEYRTRRLVLEAWDRMESDGTFTALDLSPA